jgi:hypothetical protein
MSCRVRLLRIVQRLLAIRMLPKCRGHGIQLKCRMWNGYNEVRWRIGIRIPSRCLLLPDHLNCMVIKSGWTKQIVDLFTVDLFIYD